MLVKEDLEEGCRTNYVEYKYHCQGAVEAGGSLGLGAMGVALQGRAWQPVLSHGPSQERGSRGAPGQPQPWASGTSLGTGTG